MRLITREETPKDWNSKTISYYVEKHKGGAPLRPADFSNIGFPVIPKKAIQAGNQLMISNPTYCTDEFSEKNERSIVDCSFTITTLRDLVPTGPTIGTAVNYYTDEKYILSQGVYGLKLKNCIDRNYFAYMSNTFFYRKVMRRVMVGSTQVHIRTPEYLNIEIQTPPLPEQRKIAKILSTWDKAISTTERLIDNSKQQKKALMQQLLTGKKRLLDDSGKPFEGELQRLSMSDLATIDKESLGKKTPDNFEFNYISLSDVETSRISKRLEKHVFDSSPSRARRIVRNGDILLATVRPNLKGFAKAEELHDGMIASTGFSVLSPKKNVSGSYLYHYLFSCHLTGQINALVVGSNYPAINSSDVGGLKIYCPSYSEQQKIASVLNNADGSIKTLEQQLADLKQEKKALMQQLLTGKRRVKVDETEVA